MEKNFKTKKDITMDIVKRIGIIEDSVAKCNAVMETMYKMALILQLNELAEDSEEYEEASKALDMCFEELLERIKANR